MNEPEQKVVICWWKNKQYYFWLDFYVYKNKAKSSDDNSLFLKWLEITCNNLSVLTTLVGRKWSCFSHFISKRKSNV